MIVQTAFYVPFWNFAHMKLNWAEWNVVTIKGCLVPSASGFLDAKLFRAKFEELQDDLPEVEKGEIAFIVYTSCLMCSLGTKSTGVDVIFLGFEVLMH